MSLERPRHLPAIVGHRGAPAVAPENTIAGIEAAVRAGADAVELDVRRGADHRLVLAHHRREVRRGRALALDEALAFVVDSVPVGTGLLVDVKEEGTEPDLVAALDAAGLIPRTVACAREVSVLTRLGQTDRSLRRAWSLKRARHAAAARLAPRRDVPGAAAAALGGGLTELLTVHRSLATPALVRSVHDAGGEVYVWDVNRAADATALAALGVDGLIGDDPRVLRAAVDG